MKDCLTFQKKRQYINKKKRIGIAKELKNTTAKQETRN